MPHWNGRDKNTATFSMKWALLEPIFVLSTFTQIILLVFEAYGCSWEFYPVFKCCSQQKGVEFIIIKNLDERGGGRLKYQEHLKWAGTSFTLNWIWVLLILIMAVMKGNTFEKLEIWIFLVRNAFILKYSRFRMVSELLLRPLFSIIVMRIWDSSRICFDLLLMRWRES